MADKDGFNPADYPDSPFAGEYKPDDEEYVPFGDGKPSGAEDSSDDEKPEPDADSKTESEGDEGAEDGDADGAEKEPEAEAPAIPETLKVGEAEVPTGEVLEGYQLLKGLEETVGNLGIADFDLKAAIQTGVSYGELMRAFGSGKDTAAEIVDGMFAAFVDAYGEDVKAPALRASDFDPKELEGLELSLYGALRIAQKANQDLRATNQKLAAEARGHAEKAALVDAMPKYVEAVKARFPDADVTGEQVAAMMKKHDIKDPVKAYIVDHAEVMQQKAREEGRKQAEVQKKKPTTAQSSGKEKTFDSSNMKADEIARHLKAGEIDISR
jgi:hypothetical protein